LKNLNNSHTSRDKCTAKKRAEIASSRNISLPDNASRYDPAKDENTGTKDSHFLDAVENCRKVVLSEQFLNAQNKEISGSNHVLSIIDYLDPPQEFTEYL